VRHWPDTGEGASGAKPKDLGRAINGDTGEGTSGVEPMDLGRAIKIFTKRGALAPEALGAIPRQAGACLGHPGFRTLGLPEAPGAIKKAQV